LAEHNTTQCVLFPDLFGKSVAVRFDEEQGSSDGGAILLKAAAERLGLIERLSKSLGDKRDPERVRHGLDELVAQRVYGIACGYADGNDAARLADDPVHKLLVGRDPVGGDALASQPTLSRFENGVGPRALYRMGEALADIVIDRHRKRLGRRVRRITIDLDPTDDPTHGQQQLTFFNGHYDTWCYLPVVAFATFDNEPEQYLLAAVLRPGNASAKLGALGILRRLIGRLRAAFPRARFLVRLDGGFASPDLFDFLDEEPKLDYVVAMAKNLNLERSAEFWMPRARRLSRESEKTAHVYGSSHYRAKKWTRERRVVIKAEVVRHPGRAPKENPRFVITNLPHSPQWIYEKVYCGRGEIENRIKELHHGLEIDRTSCSRFWANQFRVLLTAAAYVLMQELRLAARGTHCARAQVSTLRERLLKLGARVVVSCRRIVLHLPRSCAALHAWTRIASNLGAVSP
jgi:hypothetical protein